MCGHRDLSWSMCTWVCTSLCVWTCAHTQKPVMWSQYLYIITAFFCSICWFWGILKPPSKFVDLESTSSNDVNFCLLYFEAALLFTYVSCCFTRTVDPHYLMNSVIFELAYVLTFICDPRVETRGAFLDTGRVARASIPDIHVPSWGRPRWCRLLMSALRVQCPFCSQFFIVLCCWWFCCLKRSLVQCGCAAWDSEAQEDCDVFYTHVMKNRYIE